MSKTVLITGGTGLIGRALTVRLVDAGFDVAILTRGESGRGPLSGRAVRFVHWNARDAEGWLTEADGAYGIVNLAGYGIASGRWSGEVKRRILESRVRAGGAVSEAVRLVDRKPEIVIQASAIGFYGDRDEESLDESSIRGRGFLADVTQQWEESTEEVESFGVRRAIIRTSLVLAREAEFVRRISLPFRLFVGGPQGSGRQWVSWIHLRDETRAITFLIENSGLAGVFNLVSPNPLRNKEFTRAIGRALRRPALLGTPALILRAVFGEMADGLLLASQRVAPKRLLESGFTFIFPDIYSTLEDVFGNRSGGAA